MFGEILIFDKTLYYKQYKIRCFNVKYTLNHLMFMLNVNTDNLLVTVIEFS